MNSTSYAFARPNQTFSKTVQPTMGNAMSRFEATSLSPVKTATHTRFPPPPYLNLRESSRRVNNTEGGSQEIPQQVEDQRGAREKKRGQPRRFPVDSATVPLPFSPSRVGPAARHTSASHSVPPPPVRVSAPIANTAPEPKPADYYVRRAQERIQAQRIKPWRRCKEDSEGIVPPEPQLQAEYDIPVTPPPAYNRTSVARKQPTASGVAFRHSPERIALLRNSDFYINQAVNLKKQGAWVGPGPAVVAPITRKSNAFIPRR